MIWRSGVSAFNARPLRVYFILFWLRKLSTARIRSARASPFNAPMHGLDHSLASFLVLFRLHSMSLCMQATMVVSTAQRTVFPRLHHSCPPHLPLQTPSAPSFHVTNSDGL